MKIFHPYGSKERLFEMFERVNNLTEQVLPAEKKNEIIKEFVEFAQKKLDLKDLPKLVISYDEKEAQDMKSFGKYTPETNELRVVAVNRNLADVLRTLAHELIHHKQRENGILKPDSTETGSDVENEANALAGVFMREFGQKYPIIFE